MGLEAPLALLGMLGVLRNSIGPDSYVSDEIIRSHAGVRVRIGNTDAEGRLVLADLLSHLRVLALDAVEPRILSLATLTGHAGRAMGPYSILIENGPARAHKVADAAYSRITAEGPYFDSRVVFVAESGPKDARKKRLAISASTRSASAARSRRVRGYSRRSRSSRARPCTSGSARARASTSRAFSGRTASSRPTSTAVRTRPSSRSSV